MSGLGSVEQACGPTMLVDVPMDPEHRGVRRSFATTAAMAAVGAFGALAAEAAWVVRRNLPTFDGVDASGVLLPPDGVGERLRPLRLVAMGDSTLTGPGLDEVREIWLWQALMQVTHTRGIEVRSHAVGGARVADVRRRSVAVNDEQPDVVVVAIGCNDVIHVTPRRAFARDLDATIRTLRSTGATVAICNVGDLGNLERVPQPLASVLKVRAAIVRRQIESIVARHRGVVLLDVAAGDPGFRAGGVFVADRFHPNARGHRLWADAAVPGLQAAILRAERHADELDAARRRADYEPDASNPAAPRWAEPDATAEG